MENKEIDTGNLHALRSLVGAFSVITTIRRESQTQLQSVLGAEEKTPQQVKPEEIAEYDLVGFGFGDLQCDI